MGLIAKEGYNGMSASFDKLKGMLETKGSLSQDDIDGVVKADGEMTPNEIVELEVMRLKKGDGRGQVSMDAYLKATKILDEATEGSDEYKKAEEVVNAFETSA